MNEDTFYLIQESPLAMVASGDDLCSDCKYLLYCPGDKSLCRLSLCYSGSGWPCEFNDDGYSVSCQHFVRVATRDENWVPLPEEVKANA